MTPREMKSKAKSGSMKNAGCQRFRLSTIPNGTPPKTRTLILVSVVLSEFFDG
jgi:hypothetical protein